jgi:lysophospholipase L1-like esterase
MVFQYILLTLVILLSLTLGSILYSHLFLGGKNTTMIKAITGSAYFARVNEFKIYNRFAKPDGVVFVGDSLTQRYPLNEFYPGLATYNRGIDGDTTSGVLKRLEVSIFDIKPKIVVLQIGTNDVQVGSIAKEETITNIQSIIEKITTTDPLIKIILVSLYPVNETGEKLVERIIVGPRNNKDIQWINDRISKFKNVTFVDVYDALLDDDNQLNMRYSKEGLHLSLSGYSIVTPFILKAIERLMP